MEKVNKILLILVLGVTGLFFYDLVVYPAGQRTFNTPIASSKSGLRDHKLYYRIGTIDPRFHVSEYELASLIINAGKIWEEPLGQQVFFLDPNATFTINLIYDERQQQTEAKVAYTDHLQRVEQINSATAQDIEQQSRQVDQLRQQFDELSQTLQRQALAHENDVAFFNSQGSSSESQVQQINAEAERLKQGYIALDQAKDALNTEITRLNQMAQSTNQHIKQYNSEVVDFNRQFAKRQFEKGVYNGQSINIYEFEHKDDLTMVLAHEMGHALGLIHTNDPYSLMYPVLEKQQKQNFRLTQSDINLYHDQRK